MDLDSNYTIGIIGDRDTAKTNLLFFILESYKGKKDKYLFGYPKDYKRYRTINTLNELSSITDGLIGIDEIQRIIPFYHKRTNDDFLDLLSTMAHNGNTILFTTPLTQFITKALDGFVEGFCYTRISDLGNLKNGSKAKRRLQEYRHPRINKWSLNIPNGNYLEIMDHNEDNQNGFKTFPDMDIKKDWKVH